MLRADLADYQAHHVQTIRSRLQSIWAATSLALPLSIADRWEDLVLLARTQAALRPHLTLQRHVASSAQERQARMAFFTPILPESYYITSGSATLIMGGTIVNGRKSGPSDEVTTILNGPSCSGIMVGYTSQDVKPGDVVVIPEGVPHGFSAVPDHLTYVSIRPDLKKVLQHGYVNPALKN